MQKRPVLAADQPSFSPSLSWPDSTQHKRAAYLSTPVATIDFTRGLMGIFQSTASFHLTSNKTICNTFLW